MLLYLNKCLDDFEIDSTNAADISIIENTLIIHNQSINELMGIVSSHSYTIASDTTIINDLVYNLNSLQLQYNIMYLL